MLARARLRLTGAPENVAAADPAVLRPAAAGGAVPGAVDDARHRGRRSSRSRTVVALWVSGDPALVASARQPSRSSSSTPRTSFTDYYSENPAAVFAGTVWTNNAWIAAQCVLFGITGFWPIMVLVQNAVGVGTAAAVMIAFDRGDVFLLFILPHGLLELTCIFVAGAAGLHIFWAWVAPGRRSRGESLAAAGRSLATIAIGLVLALAVSGAHRGVRHRAAVAVAGQDRHRRGRARRLPRLHGRRRRPGAPPRRDRRSHRVRGRHADARRRLSTGTTRRGRPPRRPDPFFVERSGASSCRRTARGRRSPRSARRRSGTR